MHKRTFEKPLKFKKNYRKVLKGHRGQDHGQQRVWSLILSLEEFVKIYRWTLLVIVLSVGLSQHMHQITNLWKFWLDWSSKLQEKVERKTFTFAYLQNSLLSTQSSLWCNFLLFFPRCVQIAEALGVTIGMIKIDMCLMESACESACTNVLEIDTTPTVVNTPSASFTSITTRTVAKCVCGADVQQPGPCDFDACLNGGTCKDTQGGGHT